MNERIKEHASNFFDVNQHGYIVSPVDGYEIIEEELQKFAELIIQDCMEIVLSSDPSPKMTVREPYSTIMENIKEHFGWHDD